MMTKTTLAMLALASLSALQTASAQDAPPLGPPRELTQLAVYEGAWACDGSAPEGPLGPAHKSSTTVKAQKDLDGMWISGHVAEAASKDNPHPYRGMMHMTYDAAAKNFVMLWVDNFGGWATQTSTGWNGDKMIWLGSGSMAGKKVSVRDTFTKKGAEFQHLGELEVDGAWVVVQSEACKRPAAKK